MDKVLLNIDYTCDKKYWMDSSIKNTIVSFKEGESIHDLVKRVCADEYMELSYGGKPTGNIFVDMKDGTTKIKGYMYRGKTEIHDRDMPKAVKVNFDVWVSIYKVLDYDYEILD